MSSTQRRVQATEFSLDLASEQAPPIVRVRGEVDLHTAPMMEKQLQQLLSTGARQIVIDLAQVTFLDAAGLGALVRTANRLRQRHGGLDVRSPSSSVRKTLELTGLDAVLLTQT